MMRSPILNRERRVHIRFHDPSMEIAKEPDDRLRRGDLWVHPQSRVVRKWTDHGWVIVKEPTRPKNTEE